MYAQSASPSPIYPSAEIYYQQSGWHFVTSCTKNRLKLFGKVTEDKMLMNSYGAIVQHEWGRSASIRSEIVLDEFIVMPNHVHGIVHIQQSQDMAAVGAHSSVFAKATADKRAPLQIPRTPTSLSTFVSGFKSSVTMRINAIRNLPGQPIWQRNYYEHIIRSEEALNRIREYIIANPLNWERDPENN